MSDQTAYPGALDTTGSLADEAAGTAKFATDVVDGTDAGDSTAGSTAVGWLSRFIRKTARAIVAIETELGVDPSGSFSSVRARLDGLVLTREHGQTGEYVAPELASGGTTTAVANTAYFKRWVPTKNRTIAYLGFAVNTAGSGDVDVGIYDSAGNRLVSSGAVAGLLGTTGAKVVAIPPTAVVAGTVYYVAMSVSAGTTVFLTHNINTFVSQLFGPISGGAIATPVGMPYITGATKTASHPLPSSVSALTDAGNVPILVARES